jgi:hypothetical protein
VMDMRHRESPRERKKTNGVFESNKTPLRKFFCWGAVFQWCEARSNEKYPAN